jgi:hypothetical protein
VPETPQYLALGYEEQLEARLSLQRTLSPRALQLYRDFENATTDPSAALIVIQWLLYTRPFPEFRLAEEIACELLDNSRDTVSDAGAVS